MPFEDIEDATMQDTRPPEHMGIFQMNEEGKVVIGGGKNKFQRCSWDFGVMGASWGVGALWVERLMRSSENWGKTPVRAPLGWGVRTRETWVVIDSE